MEAAALPMNAPWLAAVRDLLAAELERLRARGVPAGDDQYRGLYISEDDAHRALGGLLGPGASGETAALDRARDALRRAIDDCGGPIAELTRMARLSPFEASCLALCYASEADVDLERVIAYAQDDVTRRRPRVELALRLCASPGERESARGAFHATAPLRRHRLVTVHDEPGQAHTPLLGQQLALERRVADYLSGREEVDAALASSVRVEEPAGGVPTAALPPDVLGRLQGLAHGDELRDQGVALLAGRDDERRLAAARALATGHGLRLLRADAVALASAMDALEGVRLADREAALQGAMLFFDRVDALDAATTPGLVDVLRDDRMSSLAVFGSATGMRWPGMTIDIPGLSVEEQVDAWIDALGGEAVDPAELGALAAKISLPARAIRDAVRSARGKARWRDPAGGAVVVDDLYAAAREQSMPILNDLATKIAPHYRWDDIVLPADTRAQLKEMCAHIEHKHLVYDTWGFGKKLAMGKGLMALFAGNSGTGKTMAADVIAGTLGLDLYKIDLSTVVSKYIGETEKNLRTIFTEAEASNAVLLFDEADALFGKRSEVKDAHDRYANIETAYLLQRMEEYSGTVILATNLKMNLDEAFMRRMHFVVDFPMPDEAHRRRIWESTLPPELPRRDDIDFAFLARQFKISGGNIRNIVLAGAFLAAADGEPLGMAHLIRATRREFQKLGRMATEADFGAYTRLLRTQE
ncbi:MAG: ATP-binding protein [Dehalococcoidia bacterium]